MPDEIAVANVDKHSKYNRRLLFDFRGKGL